jgi:hypothetical protein
MAKKPRPTLRLTTIRRALASGDRFEAITAIREAIAEKNREQKIVVWVYACILETNSAGLTILFDRYTPPEITKMERALVESGAAGTAADLRTLRQELETAVDGGMTREDAIELLQESKVARAIDRAHEAHVQEMETRLWEYCAKHDEKLTAG